MAKPIKKTKKPTASKKVKVTKKKTIALKTKRPLKKLTIKKPVKKTTKRLFTKKVKTNKKRNIIITVALACCALAAVIIPTAANQIAKNNEDQAVLGWKSDNKYSPDIPTNVKVTALTPTMYKVTFETNRNNGGAMFHYIDFSTRSYAFPNIKEDSCTVAELPSSYMLMKNPRPYIPDLDGFDGFAKHTWSAEDPSYYDDEFLTSLYSIIPVYGFIWPTKYIHVYYFLRNNPNCSSLDSFVKPRNVYFRVRALKDIPDIDDYVSGSDTITVRTIAKPYIKLNSVTANATGNKYSITAKITPPANNIKWLNIRYTVYDPSDKSTIIYNEEPSYNSKHKLVGFYKPSNYKDYNGEKNINLSLNTYKGRLLWYSEPSLATSPYITKIELMYVETRSVKNDKQWKPGDTFKLASYSDAVTVYPLPR